MLNKDEAKKIAHIALIKAISLAGSQSSLARMLTIASGRHITQPHVSIWLTRDKRISADYAITAEHVLDGQVTRHELRPDLYPLENKITGAH